MRYNTQAAARAARYAYGITSLTADCASAEQLLAWNRGHWAIESKNHYRRDKTQFEDACMAHRGLAPANRATCTTSCWR